MKPTKTELVQTIESLETEIQELKTRLSEAEETLHAISAGQVDALVVYSEDKEQIYTLQGEDYPYRVMVESIHEGAASINAEGIILYCNKRLADQLEMPLETVLGSSFYNYFPPAEQEQFTQLIQKGLAHFGRAEFNLSCSNESSIPVLITASAAEVAGQPGVCLVVTDLTEQKHAFARERELQIRLMDQREEERVRIARNLHDGPLQDLIALSYSIHATGNTVQDRAARKSLKEIHSNVLKLAGDLRNVCNELRPPNVIRFGLARALQLQSNEFQDKNPQLSISLELEYNGQTLSKELSTTIFRIYQETMNNIIRHADASSVKIRLYLEGNWVILEIEDIGVGFQLPEDWVELARQGHLGLVGMRERAETMSGKLSITTRVGQGTTVQVKLPMGSYYFNSVDADSIDTPAESSADGSLILPSKTNE